MRHPRSSALRLPTVPGLSWDDCRLLVESVVDYAIFMLDIDGHVATWNAGAEKIKGYSAKEIIGQHFSRFYTPEDLANGKPEHALECAREKGRFEDEAWRIRKDGTRFWANVVITALRDEEGILRGYGKVTRDLSARRESDELARRLLREQGAREAAEAAENRIRESEEKYRALSRRLEIVLDGVADGITVQDRDGNVVFANSAAATICGMPSAQALIGNAVEVMRRFEVQDEQGRPVEQSAMPGRRVLGGDGPSTAVLHVRDRETSRAFWVLLRAGAVFDANGRPELAVSIWHDVTIERRQKLHAVTLAHATAALGTSLDDDATIAMLTQALVPSFADACSVYVRQDDALVPGGASRAPFDPAQVSILSSVLRAGASVLCNDVDDATIASWTTDPGTLAALRAMHLEAVLVAPLRVRDRVRGVLWLASSSARRFDEDDVSLVEEIGRRAGATFETTHHYRAAQAAARAAEEASRTKDEFLATVSHELRTPLNAIVGWTSLLKDRNTDPNLTRPLDVIHRNAQAQVKIVEDILDVSRVITGKFRLDPRPCDLVSIARDAIEVVRPAAAGKRITIQFEPPNAPCLLVADPDRLQQVVWNLLSNAVKFTDSGGTVRVTLGQEKSNVVLGVTDTGKGIAPAFLPHVFERFKQADSTFARSAGGLGLGLALVKHIVELHGGRVGATSPGLGLGSTFTIVMPIRAVLPPRATRESAPPTSNRPRSPTLTGVRVLVIDDEPDARDLLLTVLETAGASVFTAGSAGEGWDTFLRVRPDVVVSDIGMPEEDGFSLIRRIRGLSIAEGGETPVIALTAFATDDTSRRALGAGFTRHLGKPVDIEALTSAVASMAHTK
jgi:PAS domain S-box-containing protein